MKKLLTILFSIYCFLLINTNLTYAADSCYLGETLVYHGNSIKAYKYYSAEDCDGTTININSITRTCNDGVLSGDSVYQYNTCNETGSLGSSENVSISSPDSGNNITLDLLDDLESSEDISVGSNGDKSILELIYTIAKDLKTIFYILSGLYFLILVIKLLFANNTEEEVGNFKKGILWITIGIIFMQIAYYFVSILYAQEIGGDLANSFTSSVISPFIKMLETATSFFFMLIAIVAFYSIITANGDEEKVKTGKMSIFYGLVGFILVKISKEIVLATYGEINCNYDNVLGIFDIDGSQCMAESQLEGINEIVVNLINWMNSFIGIIVIIMIIYVGFQVLFGTTGDDDRLVKVKKSILYICIGIAILVFNYFILSFFIIPEVTI